MKSLSKTQPKTRLLPIMALGIASFALIACQQEPETETVVMEESATPVATTVEEPLVAAKVILFVDVFLIGVTLLKRIPSLI